MSEEDGDAGGKIVADAFVPFSIGGFGSLLISLPFACFTEATPDSMD